LVRRNKWTTKKSESIKVGMPLTLGIAGPTKMILQSRGMMRDIMMIPQNHGIVMVQHGKNIKPIRRN
jgi:hypothetical protein